MSDNPFQTPLETGDVGAGDSETQLHHAANMLRQTRPWVRFISVLTFIASGMMVLGGLIMLAMGGQLAPGVGGVVGLVYLVMALLYILPAVFLWAYADRITVFLQRPSSNTLGRALESQKSFWKFVGILMLVVLAIYGIIIVVAMLGAAVNTV